MRFNVVIATHARPELMRRTLQSLADATRPPTFEHVYVIENASDSGARQACKDLATRLPIIYEHTPTPGKSRALQSVLDHLKDGFALFLDDDVRVCKTILEHYATAAAKHGQRHFFGGPLEVDYEQHPPDWLTQFLPTTARGWRPANPNELSPWVRFLGPNYGCFVQDINRVGGFNPAIGPGALNAGTKNNPLGQETDIQNRLIDDGCQRVYVPEALAWHYVPKDRCTPAFAMTRFYRAAWTKGLTETNPPQGPPWLGVPRWMWRQALALKARSILANLNPNPAERFKTKRDYREALGYIRGLRMQKSNPQRAHTPPENHTTHGDASP